MTWGKRPFVLCVSLIIHSLLAFLFLTVYLKSSESHEAAMWKYAMRKSTSLFMAEQKNNIFNFYDSCFTAQIENQSSTLVHFKFVLFKAISCFCLQPVFFFITWSFPSLRNVPFRSASHFLRAKEGAKCLQTRMGMRIFVINLNTYS